jgi:phosphomethylpyrimidine synthase
MKITQEVREFARLQEQAADASPTLSPPGRGQGEGAPTVEETEAGMAEMSKRFHDEGGEIYVPTTE